MTHWHKCRLYLTLIHPPGVNPLEISTLQFKSESSCMRHLVINKFHYLSTFIIKSTRKCSGRVNTFPLYEKQPGWISRVSVTCPIKVWGNCPPRHRRQCGEEDTKIHLSPCTSYVHPAQPNANVRGVTDCDVEMVSSSVCEHIDG